MLKNHPASPFTGLPYNEKFEDFVRWREVGALLIFLSFFVSVFGILLGFIFTFLFDNLMHLGGGPVADMFGEYPKKEPIIKYKPNCTKGPCNFCAIIQQ